MINFENVSRNILADISLNIPKGETVGLIGKSGAGKTTLIKLACGLISPSNGRVYTLGKNPVLNRRFYGKAFSAFIWGTPLLCREDTVIQGFEIIRSIYGISKADFDNRLGELSRRLDFGGYMGETVKNLSLGERMRSELAAALIYEPSLIILDEPDIGLDANAKETLRELIREMRGKGTTLLIASHDLEGLRKVCGRIALLDEGRLIFYGSPENLQSRFAPNDTMRIKIIGRLPDLEDLPIDKYTVNGGVLTLSYNSNHITAAEILKTVLRQTSVSEAKVMKPDLESVISRLKNREAI